MFDRSKMEELRRMNLNCNVFSICDYPGYTMLDQLDIFWNVINSIIKVNNEIVDMFDWLEKQGLEKTTSDILKKWLDDGTLAKVINEQVFTEISERLKDIHVNVKHYGAKGDGETDDTQAIKKAMEVLKNGTLYFPEGTYIIKDKLIFNKSCTIEGNGSTLFFMCVDSGLVAEDIISNFVLKNIKIMSNYTNNNGVVLRNIHHSTLQDVWIQGHNENGLYVEGCFISNYVNVTSIENKARGAFFDSDMKDPSNNNIRIERCNFSKNGLWNLEITAHYIYTITGLDAEQFDYIPMGDMNVHPKGSIKIDNAKVVNIRGLYIESYQRGDSNQFAEDYVSIVLGTDKLGVENCSIDGYLISGNNNGRNGVKLNKVRSMYFGSGEIKNCLKGIQNIDPNNTVVISPLADIGKNSQAVDSDKKYLTNTNPFNPENIISEVDVKGGKFLLHRANQNQYIDRVILYYIDSTNNYASQAITLKVGKQTLTANLLPNKTSPYLQPLSIKNYMSNGEFIELEIAPEERATGKIYAIVEKLNVY